MKTKNLLAKLNEVFPDTEPPSIVTICCLKNSPGCDAECMAVENDFANRKRNSLPRHECSMLIIDSALISDSAFKYFIPRLAKAVIDESCDSFLFGNRLERIEDLTMAEKIIIDPLVTMCRSIDDEDDVQQVILEVAGKAAAFFDDVLWQSLKALMHFPGPRFPPPQLCVEPIEKV